jgi:hypothetical protein
VSFPDICSGCAWGKHSQHKDWEGPAVPEGTDFVGGTSCDCKGECEDPNLGAGPLDGWTTDEFDSDLWMLGEQ